MWLTKVSNFGDIRLTLSVEESAALATVLGRIVDRTPTGSTADLYMLLTDAGIEDEHFSIDVEENVDYDPSDEDDQQYRVVLDVR